MKSVIFKDKEFKLDEINKSFIQKWLKEEHLKREKSRLKCLCKGRNQPVDISFFKLKEHYHLRRLPNSGDKHHPKCQFFAEPEMFSGLKAYTHDALKIKDGKISMSVNVTIKQGSESQLTEQVSRHRSQGENHERQNKLTIMGIASVLFEQSRTYCWDAGDNLDGKWARHYYKILDVIDNTVINRTQLKSNFHLIGFYYKDENVRFNEFLINLSTIKKYGFIMGEIKNFHQAPHSMAVKFKNTDERLFFTDSVYEKMAISFPNEITAIENDSDNQKVMGLFYVESKGKNAIIHQAVLFSTNKHYIPVSSSYELRLADHLIENNRSFNKPMRYDAGDNAFFPDFVLRDTGSKSHYCEVWGMANNPDYERRKNEKIEFYNSQPVPLWQWDAVNQLEIPGLPIAVQDNE